MWIDFVAKHYGRTLAAYTSRAWQLDESVRCQMLVGASPELAVPFYPDIFLTERPPLRRSDTEAGQ